ncbi:hypothetical protein ACTXOW_14725 [Corynebacterium variabile]|nr:hypothetical protein [Acidipropionibacterium jensenii]MDN6513302.1 hypothetical protein [Acidipropionibacterium jensenii]
MVCLECGTELTYTGRGRRPRYCSSSCRHRAWERRRAADDGVIASRVVELPALPMEPTYTRTGVIEWLRGNPRRLADVAGALPDSEDAARMLDTARRRLRDHGVRTEDDRIAESRALQNREREQRERHAVVQEMERLRQENRRLRAELDRSRESDRMTQPSGSPAPASSGRTMSATGRDGARPTSPRTASNSTGTPLPSVGFRAVEVSGRTFHVPEGWPRARVRKWCRSHPDEAVG